MNELTINGKGLFTDFDSYIAERTTTHPQKKSIKEEIPFSNVVYDFSSIDGEIYYNEREVSYIIDIAELTRAENEQKRRALVNWLFAVENANIYDPYLNGYHFKGTFASDKWAEDFDGGQLTVTFDCYPYLIANEPTINTFTLAEGENSITVINNSSHRVVPIFTTENAVTLTFNDSSYALSAGENQSDNIMLSVGTNTFTVNATGAGAFTVNYVSEVL